jgi:Cell division protein
MNNINNGMIQNTAISEKDLNHAVTGITMPEQMADALLADCLHAKHTRNFLFRYSRLIAAALAVIIFTAVGTTSYAAYNLYQTKNLMVFFDYGISQEQIDAIGQELSAISGLYSLWFKSGDDAWIDFQQQYLTEDIAAQFTENPLKDSSSYCVTVKLNADTNTLREQIEQIDGVRLVNDLNELKEAERSSSKVR